MSNYSFVLPFTVANDVATVLLAQRNLIQKREQGRPIKGKIPEWAGQWGLIGTQQQDGEMPADAALRAFHEQAGIDTADEDIVTNFALGNRQLVNLQLKSLTSFYVLCIFTTSSALSLLGMGINGLINEEQPAEDVLQSVAVMPIAKARQQLGPLLPPPQGWRSYLVDNYYGGKQPGQLNTEIDTLTKALTDSAQLDNSFFTAALAANEKN